MATDDCKCVVSLGTFRIDYISSTFDIHSLPGCSTMTVSIYTVDIFSILTSQTLGGQTFHKNQDTCDDGTSEIQLMDCSQILWISLSHASIQMS